MRRTLWQSLLAVGTLVGLLCLGWPGLPPESSLLIALGACSAVAIVIGVRLNQPAPARPWYLLAASVVAAGLGTVLASVVPGARPGGPAPAGRLIGEAASLCAYPLAIAACSRLALGRDPRRDRGGLIDALIVSAAAALAGWAVLIVPALARATAAGPAGAPRLLLVAFPAAGAVLLAVTARLGVTGAARRTEGLLLLAGLICLAGADTVHGLGALGGATGDGPAVVAGWVGFFILCAASSLHPGVADLAGRGDPGVAAGVWAEAAADGVRLSRRRLGFLTATVMTAPAVLLFERHRGNPTFVAIAGATVLFLLVVARMAGLIHRYEESLERERLVRDAGAALASATSTHDILTIGLKALQAIMGTAAGVSLVLLTATDEVKAVPGPTFRPARALTMLEDLSPGERAVAVHGRAVDPGAVGALARRLGLIDPQEADEPGPPAWAGPIIDRPDLHAVVVVTGQAVSPAAQRSVPALAAQLAFALKSRELTEQLQRQRSEARFRTLIQNATDVVWVVSRDSTIIYLTPSVSRVLGMSAEDLVGRQLWPLVHPDDRVGLLALLESGPGRDATTVAEFRLRHPEGSWRWMESSLTNLTEDPDVGGIVLNARDVSERRRAQAEHEQLTGRLAQAQRLEAIGQLAGGVAHDFNNVLGAILMYANVLEKAVGSLPTGSPDASTCRDKMARDVAKIGEAAQRGAALVNELLILGRREVVNPEIIDLNELVGELQDLARDTLGERIRLHARLAPGARKVTAERNGVERVLMNLVINARDAMPEGGTLTIETTNVDIDEALPWAPELHPGHYVRLTVSDTGGGMTREVRARAFEPFFTTKPSGSGSGLGLATVYGIVKQAAGDIHLFSEPTVGTMVRVYLPAAPQPDVAHLLPLSSPQVPVAPPAVEEPAPHILPLEGPSDVRAGLLPKPSAERALLDAVATTLERRHSTTPPTPQEVSKW